MESEKVPPRHSEGCNCSVDLYMKGIMALTSDRKHHVEFSIRKQRNLQKTTRFGKVWEAHTTPYIGTTLGRDIVITLIFPFKNWKTDYNVGANLSRLNFQTQKGLG